MEGHAWKDRAAARAAGCSQARGRVLQPPQLLPRQICPGSMLAAHHETRRAYASSQHLSIRSAGHGVLSLIGMRQERRAEWGRSLLWSPPTVQSLSQIQLHNKAFRRRTMASSALGTKRELSCQCCLLILSFYHLFGNETVTRQIHIK